MTGKMPTSQITMFDITFPLERYENELELGKGLNGWCSKYVFQKEKSDSGYEHWQCRVQLVKKRRVSEVLNMISPVIGGHWSPTCNKTHHSNSFNYVMKEDTKVAGPWTEKSFMDPPVLTRQLKAFMEKEKRGWQEDVEEIVRQVDDRKITLIYDTIGNSGKSIFAEYLEYHRLALELPPLRQFEDLLQFAYGFENQKAYLVDMPRAMKKDKLSEFYSGLECLKNGVVWDKRYAAKKRRMDRPQIIVFTNTLPEWTFMSKDRWACYEMDDDYTLSPFQIDSGDFNVESGGTGAAL
ncbi:MAG: replication associated protein [Cressdnaviricota sp.]|nr:MAG: replication associated protein [Cressdnaviricota sp.]